MRHCLGDHGGESFIHLAAVINCDDLAKYARVLWHAGGSFRGGARVSTALCFRHKSALLLRSERKGGYGLTSKQSV
ncbi:hypothetical protein NtRootA4_41650 (plasmid) [Arthrobacter sp. NtRootA4]|nr:hypothetical protein NtRootA2_42110 [Arthrobacter sp. NtRootA2]BCW17186.1 hypothetical protein NtRootA4_41650 [Arthrobacter sp. NtRootA4]BCW25294.1 hypothetical protein NtRootC7_41610 [Arthrobacter sp. NtRootC7]BCW29656.1 hypothetical protein NtRootC45_42560 [Arthrobacter sp. NtRootC45]BCW33807.1 hypothetical protein NtRootD5_41380 [Arthrobacter sp. NtRootD5]BCW86595.1 hypothetical protein NicSoilE8_42680 [Arthrobacter sp. NicSoilE8]GGV41390.1 hypothetical protein GCM10010212_32870 [Paenar